VSELSPDDQRRGRTGWYAYDLATHSYIAVVGTVLFAPYLTSVATTAACGSVRPCHRDLTVAGVAVSPGSLVFYAIPLATIIATVFLPLVGAAADRARSPRRLLGLFAFTGAAATVAMAGIGGGDWQLGVGLLTVTTICLACSVVVTNSLLHDLASPDERDAVSARGWAAGYVGSTICLAVALVVVTAHASLSMTKTTAVLVCFAFAGLWWAAFTVVPLLMLPDRPGPLVAPVAGAGRGQLVAALRDTYREVRAHPQSGRFLLVALLINDGIGTVVGVASTYGSQQLGLSQQVLLATILGVQVVAVVGALAFGRLAGRVGSRRMILVGLVAWMAIIVGGWVLPAHRIGLFLILAAAIGLMLGGVQALSRSVFSQVTPADRQAAWFSLYQATQQGTSWFATLVFGLVHQIAGSYRPALGALLAFFVAATVLLLRTDLRRAVREAGNPQPRTL
jgi:UMF1 family MFS transporter